MTRIHRAIARLVSGIVLFGAAIMLLWYLNLPLSCQKSIIFTGPDASPAATADSLEAAWVPGSLPRGILLVSGFGSDRTALASSAAEFAHAGWHVFSFDFPGQGSSPGALTMDNARSPRLSRLLEAAMAEFVRLSGLSPDSILILGHSLGARVALETSTRRPGLAGGLILLGTQVNLTRNAQSEFFTGTSDSDLPWVRRLGPDLPALPVHLISGTWDDILTPSAARLLRAVHPFPHAEPRLRITHPRRFILARLLLWLPALPLALIIGALCFLVPGGKPVFNLIYVCFLGAWGLISLVLYKKGIMPGTTGRLPFASTGPKAGRASLAAGLAIIAVMLMLSALLAGTGLFHVFAFATRLHWLLLFTPLSALGFWISIHESNLLKGRPGIQVLNTLLGYLPFLALTVLYAILGSATGMVGNLQGLLVLAFATSTGRAVHAASHRPWLAALGMALVLYWLVLPQGALIQ